MKSASDIAGVRQKVISVVPLPDGEGWLVELACGHKQEWKIAPPLELVTCKDCLDALAKRISERGLGFRERVK